MSNVGGQNAVTAIYLGYRVYDTLFEALILVIAVVAVSHMSWSSEESVADGHHSEIENYSMAVFTMRIICPIILVFGVYLILNGHISAGGGFQGGLVIASFFICRYLIYGIYDIPVKKVIQLEEMVFINIIIVAALAIFLGTGALLPVEFSEVFQIAYLVIMNIMIGLKVACGFFILFYRFVAIERMET
jgi:multicomponent Na+:H+ antiporter subunit B